jgi:predicted CopG family antitoxin
MAISDTAIAVSSEVRDTLHHRKEPGDSYDDVLRRMLDRPEIEA